MAKGDGRGGNHSRTWNTPAHEIGPADILLGRLILLAREGGQVHRPEDPEKPCGQDGRHSAGTRERHGADAQSINLATPKQLPRIVCLCGSTRFYDAFQAANYRETMAGRIVLSVGFYLHSQEMAHGENVACTNAQKIALDDLHKRKIDLADEILVLDVGGYIGASTRSEIEYAEKTGKSIRYLSKEQFASQETKYLARWIDSTGEHVAAEHFDNRESAEEWARRSLHGWVPRQIEPVQIGKSPEKVEAPWCEKHLGEVEAAKAIPSTAEQLGNVGAGQPVGLESEPEERPWPEVEVNGRRFVSEQQLAAANQAREVAEQLIAEVRRLVKHDGTHLAAITGIGQALSDYDKVLSQGEQRGEVR